MDIEFKERLKANAFAVTPKATNEWMNLDDSERANIIRSALDKCNFNSNILEFVEAKKDGQVIFRILNDINPSERGELLLDLEFMLKKEVHDFIFINIEPLGDKNSLRKLRGIDIKKETT